ncbi:hypothetical protein IEO21_01488 [Rhodonia placenta]|uniref:Uncharacterized protein n=1 Tax=Rhodonia placenta TaxID=104341 RepID=A0A8H7P9Q4_9APHY|nr:hypothetical protein IEO21_01488 [Postia placenta]
MHQQSYTHNIDPRDPDGNVRCYAHDVIVPKLVSHTILNPNRQPLPPAAGSSGTPYAHVVQPAPETPKRPSQKERAALARKPSTQASPAKRPRTITPPPTDGPHTSSAQGYSSRTPIGQLRERLPMTLSSAFTPSQKQRRNDAITAALEGPTGNGHYSCLADKDIAQGTPQRIFQSSSQEHSYVPRERCPGAETNTGQAHHGDFNFAAAHPPLRNCTRADDYDSSPEPESPQPSLYSTGIQTSPVASTCDIASQYSQYDPDYPPQEVLDDEHEVAHELLSSRADASVYGTPSSTPVVLEEDFSLSPTPRTPVLGVGRQAHPHGTQSTHSHGLPTPPQSSPLGLDILQAPSNQPSEWMPMSPARDKGVQQENPFQEHAPNLQPSRWDSQSSSLSQQSERPTANTAAGSPSADTVALHLRDLAGVPNVMRKYERKQAAMQNILDIKDKTIDDLRTQVAQLQEKNRRLELDLETLRTRR